MKKSAPYSQSSFRGRLLSSGVQAMAIQIIGTIFYYFLSLRLSKNDFGAISWANACSALLVTFLSLGVELIVARRLAAHRNEDWPAAVFLFHAALSTVATIGALAGLAFLLKGNSDVRLLLLFFAVQSCIFLAAPLKQLLNARERFQPYAVISLISNVGKLVGAYLLYKNAHLTIVSVGLLLLCTGGFEVLSLLVFTTTKVHFSLRFKMLQYKSLLVESLPQYLSVLFDLGLARADWILMGWLSTRAETAEYTFAYRGFEMGRLPLNILAPLLLPRFARMLLDGITDEQKMRIRRFFNAEMLFANGVLVLAVILWVPVITWITGGKYGSSNAIAFWLLIFSLPPQFAYNYFWNLSFSARKYRQISVITVITTVVNIVLNVIFIPRYGGIGAAGVYLVSGLLQAVLHYRLAVTITAGIDLKPALLFYIASGLSFATMLLLPNLNLALIVLIVLAVFLAFVGLSRQAKGISIHSFRNLLDS